MIISILGTSGAFKNRDTCTPQREESGAIKFQSAMYYSKVLNKKSRTYKNATEFLLKSYDDKFVFIGTQCAIDFQKIILKKSLKNKDVIFVPIEDDSLDDIFEKILELLQQNNQIILDITHGFRHQPIMAIFASTLAQFLQTKELKIIFAKEVVMYEEYRYIYLDDYIEIIQISLLLTGFIRTLNFIPIKDMKLLNNKIFENFSKSLLSNDIKGIECNYKTLTKELLRLKQSKDLKHISSLIEKVENELKSLAIFSVLSPFQKYILLSKITVDKNYLIIALAYLFESLKEYCTYQFEAICKDMKFKDDYQRNDSVMKTIGNFRERNKILRKYSGLYHANKEEFKKVNKLYKRLRKRRNTLAHINKTKDFHNIRQDLEGLIFEVEALFNAQVLSDIKFK
jgi:CRISPR-associated DxTHG motif protein